MAGRVGAVAAAVGLALASSAGRADEESLAVGDPAPALAASRWIGGRPIGRFEPGRVYALTFIDTRSASSLESLPHVADLAGRFKRRGVEFALIVTDPPERETEATGLLADLEPPLGVRIAVDRYDDQPRRRRDEEPEGVSWKGWMVPAGEAGVPTSFVVDGAGTIAWIGHPLDGLDDVVERMLSGGFDAAAEAAAAKRARLLEEAAFTAVERGRWDEALDTIRAMVAAQPRLAGRAAGMKVEVLLFQKGDLDAGCAAAADLLDGPADHDAELLNDVAQRILDLPGATPAAIAVALSLAIRADDLLDHADPFALDTLAHAHFLTGDHAAAVTHQERAVELVADRGDKAEKRAFRRRLRTYREALAEEPAP